MANVRKSPSTNVDHNDTNVASQDTFVMNMAARVRDRASDLGLKASDVAANSGIKSSAMTNYWSGKRAYPIEVLPRLAATLNTNVEQLLTGRAPQSATVVDASQADWIEVPEYDLREMTDELLGKPIAVSPIRRDWLNITYRAASSLFLTRLQSDYPAADLDEGALVICREISVADLNEGNICLWRVQGKIVIGRFSVMPDAARNDGPAQPGRYLASYLDPALGGPSGELLVPPSRIGEDGTYHLVGRILGVMIRPL
jgi:transcriptional regulator with XRE-family HTH domain